MENYSREEIEEIIDDMISRVLSFDDNSQDKVVFILKQLKKKF